MSEREGLFSVNLIVFLFLYQGRDARLGNCDLIPTRHMPGHPGHPGDKEADRICFAKDRTGETRGAVSGTKSTRLDLSRPELTGFDPS